MCIESSAAWKVKEDAFYPSRNGEDRFGKLLPRRSFNLEKERRTFGFPLNRFTKTFERGEILEKRRERNLSKKWKNVFAIHG